MALNKKAMKAKNTAKALKRKLLTKKVEHIDITKMHGIVPVVEAMEHMAYSSRDLNNAASQVRTMQDSDLNYGLLADLNTRPRTTYLWAFRNPNPAIERLG